MNSSFQTVGKTPWIRQQLYMFTNGAVSFIANSLRSFSGKSMGKVDLVFFRLLAFPRLVALRLGGVAGLVGRRVGQSGQLGSRPEKWLSKFHQ